MSAEGLRALPSAGPSDIWSRANRVMVANAASLMGASVVMSGLGYPFWWIAARTFEPADVGLAAAAISAMTLIATFGVLGLQTLLISQLPHHPGKERSLITAAMLVAGATAAAFGAAFALAAPLGLTELWPLREGLGSVALFSLAAGLSAMLTVVDGAATGLLRGEVRFGRNVLFASAKLGVLLPAGLWASVLGWLAILVAWVSGQLVSLAAVGVLAAGRGGKLPACRPDWRLLRGLRRSATGHHLLNLALGAPYLALPILVANLLSTTTNAYFYAAWMVAAVAFAGPGALATALYAVGARAPTSLAPRLRATLAISLIGSALACAVLLAAAREIMGLFGPAYAKEAGPSLQILGLGLFPSILESHYLAICRVYGRIRSALRFAAAGGLLILLLAYLGGLSAGLEGVCIGLVAGLFVQALVAAPTVCRAAFSTDSVTLDPLLNGC